MDQVRIVRYIDLQEAQIAAGLLRSRGLTVHLQNENLGAVDFLIRQAIGGFGLWVPEAEAAEARAILKAVSPTELEPGDEAVVRDLGEPADAPVALTLGVLGAFLPFLWPVAEVVRRRRWPRSLSGSGVLIAFIAAMAGVVAIMLLSRLSQGYHEHY